MLKTVVGMSVAVLVGAVILANVARTSFRKGGEPKGTPPIAAPAQPGR